MNCWSICPAIYFRIKIGGIYLNTREVIYNILYDVFIGKGYSNLVINKYIKKAKLEKKDENLIREVVYGTIENFYYERWIIRKFSSVKYKKIEDPVKIILLMSLYQLFKMNNIPEHAICHEAVELSKKVANISSSKFVNGILRNVMRNKEEIHNNFEKLGRKDKLSIQYSYPLWAIENLIEEHHEEFVYDLVSHSNDRPEFSIRVNTIKISRENLKSDLEDDGYKVSTTRYANEGLIIENPQGIFMTKWFLDGYFIVQDEASMLVGQILNPSLDSKVLDLCSAPGGKTTHIAQLMKNTGCVVSQDIHEHKLLLIEENAKRLGLENIEIELQDATELEVNPCYDFVLADVPCSGTGIVRRKPEIKWSKTEKDIIDLLVLQKEILKAASSQVKDNGILVYSTCSINKSENLNLIESFLAENKDFQLKPFENEVNLAGSEKGYLEIYYNELEMDGFFIAKLQKK